MTPTVQDGAQLYRAHHTPRTSDPADDLRAQPGTVAWGRLLRRASNGDPEAQQVARKWAARGDDNARDVLDGAGAPGFHVTEGSTGDVPPDLAG